MEALYKTKVKYTFEEYKKFNQAILKKQHFYHKLLALELLLVLFGATYDNVIFFIVAILFPISFFVFLNKYIKDTFNSNKVIQNIEVCFEFYEDFFIEKQEIGESKVEYNKLNEIIETDTNFYLMIGKEQGFMLSKKEFPDGLNEFLRKINKE